MKHYVTNRRMLGELLPEVQWAAYKWLDVCRDLNLNFRISEVYRTQERQNQLYAQGRTKAGPVVTWTLKSFHTLRLAVDVYPENCTHEQIANIASLYHITHPFPSFDPPHYQFDAVPPPRSLTPNVDARIRAIQRGLKRASGHVKLLLQNQLQRILARRT